MKILTAIAAALIALVVAVPAHADTPSDVFLEDMGDYLGVVIAEDDEADYLVVGLAVCVDLFNGISMDDEIDTMVDDGVPVSQASAIVNIAQATLCPRTLKGAMLK